jgi:ribonuclease BN (tRNA processing enzyme)
VDHLYALPSLIHTAWLDSYHEGGRKVALHGLPSTLKTAKKLIDSFGLQEKSNSLSLEFNELDNVGTLDKSILNGWEVEYFRVNHGSIPTLGLSFYRGNRHLLFSADSEVCEALESRIRPESSLIHDCGAGLGPQRGHANAEAIAEMLSNNECKEVVLIHLKEWDSSDMENIRNKVLSSFSGEVIIPDDGYSFIK